ncbi:hypothetical protein CALCODRAFT_296818 [Calocera cornea HHB12733]|uniref:Uncharacterized protein n=1 Tax=Calocera cornea HHB12733 TaxID=1353952 RepID=A0A165FLJ5_9BASI|nr:hypothetical protein CALCODRAFT_296818 [Calocera cornea HHB12733]
MQHPHLLFLAHGYHIKNSGWLPSTPPKCSFSASVRPSSRLRMMPGGTDGYGQQALRIRPVIVLKEPLSTIGDHITSLPPLTVDEKTHLRTILDLYPKVDVASELQDLQTNLLESYRSRINVCPRDIFDQLLCRHNKHLHSDAAVLIQLGTLRLAPYDFYLAVMGVCGGALKQLTTYDCIDIAQDLDCSFPGDDGRSYLSPETLLHLCLLCKTLLHPIHADFLRYQFSSFSYHVLRARLNLAPLDPAAPYALTPLTIGELELRDQLIQIGWTYSESFLLERQYPPDFLQTLRDLNFYVVDDEKMAAILRTQNRLYSMQGVKMQVEQEKDKLFAIDLAGLTFLATGVLPLCDGVQRSRDNIQRKIGALDLQAHPIQPSPTDPDIVAAFWKLFNMCHRLADALADVMPFWEAYASLPPGLVGSHISRFLELHVLLRKQHAVLEGLHALTGVPLYYLSFTQLLQLSNELHMLHTMVAKELALPRPVHLEMRTAWPGDRWFRARGLRIGFGSGRR